MQRKLAAILAADIVGYSALMSADEKGALDALRLFRSELFGPAVASRHGKVIKSMGDGWLVEFSSAEDAAICAMRIQDRIAGHQIIKLRIGVHIGDIVHEGDDIFGDGVNIAARLEALSEPGAVVVSDAVYGALDGTLRPSFEGQGERKLKNIDRTVKIWTRGGAIAGASVQDQPTAVTRLDIAPVETSDSRDEVRELADALTYDLHNHLGNIQFMQASVTDTPSSTAFAFRSVLRAQGDRIRLEVRLSAPDGETHWIKKYDGDLNDSFDWQDSTALEAVSHFHSLIIDAEFRRLEAKPLDTLTAAEAMAAAGAMPGGTFNARADLVRRLHEHAIETAPGWGVVYVAALQLYYLSISGGRPGLFAAWEARVDMWFERAQSLLHDDPHNEMRLALARHLRKPEPERLYRLILNALRSMPFDPNNLTICGFALMFLGRPSAAQDCAKKALEFSSPSLQPAGIVSSLALLAVQLGNYEEALEHARHALTIHNELAPAWRAIAAAASHLGRSEEAREAVDMLETLHPGDTLTAIRARSGYVDNEHTRRLFDGLRLAGVPE